MLDTLVIRNMVRKSPCQKAFGLTRKTQFFFIFQDSGVFEVFSIFLMSVIFVIFVRFKIGTFLV